MPVQGTYMVKVWNKLKQMKVAMKQLNNKDFSKVEQRILESRRHLLEIQEQLRDCYHGQERRFQKLCSVLSNLMDVQCDQPHHCHIGA